MKIRHTKVSASSHIKASSSVVKPDGGDGKTYFMFYTGPGYSQNTPEAVLEYCKPYGFDKLYWGSDTAYGMKGMYNGDTYIVYRDANDLPDNYREDALFAEAQDAKKAEFIRKNKEEMGIESKTYIYEFGMDDGDAESGPIVHNNRYEFETDSLEDAQRMGDEMFSGEDGFVGGYAREATQEELDEIAKWADIEKGYVFEDGNVWPIEGATVEEMQAKFEEYRKAQERMSQQLDDLQNDQFKKADKRKKGIFKRAFAAECHKVSEDDNSINYIVSSETVGQKWMAKYLTVDGKVKKIYFNCETDDWDEAVEKLEEIIPEPYQSCKLLGTAPANIAQDEEFTYIEGAIPVDNINPEVMEELKRKLGNEIHRFMVDVCGFDEEDDPNDKFSMGADNFWRIDVEETTWTDGSKGIYIEVGAELGYDSTDKLLDRLNNIVKEYDSEAYFEPYDPGISVCYLWADNVNASTTIEGATPDPVSTTRDKWLDGPDEGDSEELDEAEQHVYLDFDVTIDIADDGSYDYESLEFAKSNTSDGNWYVEEVDGLDEKVQLRDYISVVEDMDDLLMYMLPPASGKHTISGQADLVYLISGLVRYDDGTVLSDNLRVRFDRQKSEINDFKFDDEPVKQ